MERKRAAEVLRGLQNARFSHGRGRCQCSRIWQQNSLSYHDIARGTLPKAAASRAHSKALRRGELVLRKDHHRIRPERHLHAEREQAAEVLPGL